MLILTVDTALRNCNIVLARNAEIIQELVLGDEMRHSSRVLEAVDVIMRTAGATLADLDGLAVTAGPGSFTGLRIGMSTVKGLAFALNKPVAALCVLEALAHQAETNGDEQVTALIDGSKQEVFLRKYTIEEFGLVPTGGYCNLNYQAAAESIDAGTVLIGNGVPLVEPFLCDNVRALVTLSPPAVWTPQNQTLARLAQNKFEQGGAVNGGAIVPNYIRKSDAEINLTGKK